MLKSKKILKKFEMTPKIKKFVMKTEGKVYNPFLFFCEPNSEKNELKENLFLSDRDFILLESVGEIVFIKDCISFSENAAENFLRFIERSHLVEIFLLEISFEDTFGN